MGRKELLNYLKGFHANDLKQIEEFKEVLVKNINVYTDTYPYSKNKDDEILLLFTKRARLCGGILSELNKLQEAAPLYNKMQIVISDLYNRDKVDYHEKNSFDVMQVKCLAETGKKRKAINLVWQIFNDFRHKKKEIVEKLEKSYPRAVADCLLSLKSLCRFARSLCNQIGLTKESGEFYYRERLLERFTLRRGAIDDRIDSDLRNEHKAQFSDSAPMTIYLGSFLNEIQGWWKRIKFRLSVCGKLIFNWGSFVLWGYGERVWRIVACMVGIIVIFAIIFFKFKFIDTNNMSLWNCLYFSIVTFTTLGYGDIRPMDCVTARLIASIEAFLGACGIALFIFALGRKADR